VNATDRQHLAAIVADRNTPQKHVLARTDRAADGAKEIIRQRGAAKTTV
jgi:hypothetical protein